MGLKESNVVFFRSLTTKKISSIVDALIASEHSEGFGKNNKKSMAQKRVSKDKESIKTLETDRDAFSFLKIGIITHVHGLKGEVFVSLFSQEEEISSVIVDQIVQIKKDLNTCLETSVHEARSHKRGLIIKLKNVNTRQEAEMLKGAILFVPKKVFSSLKGENIYLCEVLNFEVRDQQLGVLGKIYAFSSNGAQDLLLVKDEKGTQVEIPFIKAFVVHVDFKLETVQVDLPSNWPCVN